MVGLIFFILRKDFKGKLASFPSPTHQLYRSKPIPQNKEKKNFETGECAVKCDR